MKNESAFPRIDAPSLFTEGGLTKRELFAAMAMQSVCTLNGSVNEFGNEAFYAKRAVELADALIAELERKEE